ncbi:MAG: HAD family hydrolase [Kiritimatiellae bacterium]|nr:HAD family hydrolase [Kiritimatiellia bacterium]
MFAALAVVLWRKFAGDRSVNGRSRGIRRDHNLSSSGLSGFFDVVVTGRDVRNGKLVPDIFLLAAEKIGVPPNECVVFEDSFNGIRAAHAAGAKPRLA